LTTNPRRGRPRLHLAPPAELPDTRAAVARALLGPVHPVLDNQALAILGDSRELGELHSDPRFVIGRLFQALTALLERDVPPMDATAQLLDEAIRDAIACRHTTCPKCPLDEPCTDCAANWGKALRYEGLWDALGVIGELPKGRPDLKAAGR
jgi:hypothetical protein